jgi:hypothetical protein
MSLCFPTNAVALNDRAAVNNLFGTRTMAAKCWHGVAVSPMVVAPCTPGIKLGAEYQRLKQ